MSAAPSTGARAALGLAAAMCALPPLVGLHVAPLPTFAAEWLAASLGAATCLALLVSASRARLPSGPMRAGALPRTAVPLVAFVGVLALQLGVIDVAYPQQVQLGMLYVLFAGAMLACGLALREAVGIERAATALAWAFAASGCGNAVAALLQAYAPGAMLGTLVVLPTSTRLGGNLGQANLLGDQLALGLASLAYLAATGRARPILVLSAALLTTVVLALTGSRSPWLYCAWFALWSVLAYARTGGAAYRLATLAALAVGALVLVLPWVLPAPVARPFAPDVGTAAARLAELATGAGIAAEGRRAYFWRQAWAMFMDAPLLGTGFGQYAAAFFARAPDFAGAASPGLERNAHNLVLHLLAETGAAGTLCVAAALVLWARGFARARTTPETWWLGAGVGVVVLHALIEYPLWYAHFLGPFALLLGLGETRTVGARLGRVLRPVYVALALGGVVLLASLAYNFLEVRRWVYGVPEAALADPAVVVAQRDAVGRLLPTLMRPYVELPLASTIAVDRDALEEKIALNGRVLRFAPIAPVVFRQAVFLELAGRHDEAARVLDAAAVLYPESLPSFAVDLERLSARGDDVARLSQHLAAKRGKN